MVQFRLKSLRKRRGNAAPDAAQSAAAAAEEPDRKPTARETMVAGRLMYTAIYSSVQTLAWLAIAYQLYASDGDVATVAARARRYSNLAWFEVAHVLVGLTPSAFAHVLLPVIGRSLLIRLIVSDDLGIGSVDAVGWPWATVLVATWAAMAVARHPYLASRAFYPTPPRLLTYIRFNSILITHPLAALSACVCIFRLLPLLDAPVIYAAGALLAAVPLASFVLMRHMLAKRRGKQAKGLL